MPRKRPDRSKLAVGTAITAGVRQGIEAMVGVNKPAHRREHDGEGGIRTVFYTIGDVTNDTSLPLTVTENTVGTITGLRVDGPTLSADTFDLKVNSTVITTATEGAGAAECLQQIAVDDTVEVVVNTISAGTGAALCQVTVTY